MEEECKNPRCLKRIRELGEELDRIRSVGFDMLKQRGNWQASGTEPAHLGMEFDSIFTHEVEEMSEVFVRNSGISENEARKLLSTAFQDVYNTCKETILDKMRDTLSRVLTLPKEQESDEDLYDICRAYGLLLNVCSKSAQSHERRMSYSRQLLNQYNESLEEFKEFTEKMKQFSRTLLETVPPLVSETIADTPFCKDWHEKELHPDWKEDLVDYSLVYYRPILFFSYEGKVAQKGWVGNTLASHRKDQSRCIDTLENAEVLPKDVKCVQDSYKKPHLRVQTSSSAVQHQQPSFDSTRFNPEPEQGSVSEDFEQLPYESAKNYPSDYSFGLKNY